MQRHIFMMVQFEHLDIPLFHFYLIKYLIFQWLFVWNHVSSTQWSIIRQWLSGVLSSEWKQSNHVLDLKCKRHRLAVLCLFIFHFATILVEELPFLFEYVCNYCLKILLEHLLYLTWILLEMYLYILLPITVTSNVWHCKSDYFRKF